MQIAGRGLIFWRKRVKFVPVVQLVAVSRRLTAALIAYPNSVLFPFSLVDQGPRYIAPLVLNFKILTPMKF